MIRFIDEHRDQFGVEFLCRVLRDAVPGFLTSRGYRAAKTRVPSARQLKDELLVPEIQRLHEENYGVYGVRKMHALLRREGWDIGRDQTARLMKLAGVRGVARSKKVFTTKSDPTIAQPMDLVERNFTAPAPNRLWVADITYVGTWAGMAYVAFVIDVFSRMIVGWQVSTSLYTDLALDALKMAIWRRQHAGADLSRLIHHSDRGVQYRSIRYTERLAEADAVASVGSKGDSYDNALAEAFNSLYKGELVRNRGPWTSINDLEIATAEYIDWFNNRRLHGEIGHIPPAELEALHAASVNTPTLIETN